MTKLQAHNINQKLLVYVLKETSKKRETEALLDNKVLIVAEISSSNILIDINDMGSGMQPKK